VIRTERTNVRTSNERNMTAADYKNDFRQFELTAPGNGRLRETRRAALDRFADLDFPTTQDEEWRFTNVAPIARTRFAPAPRSTVALAATDAERLALAEAGAVNLVFVDGHFSSELSHTGELPAGVEVESLASALRAKASGKPAECVDVENELARHAGFDRSAFSAWNTAFLADGACIRIGRGVAFEKPIHITFVAAGAAQPTVNHPRNLIVLQDGAVATVVETYVGSTGHTYLTNAVTEVVLGKDSVLDHIKVQRESPTAYHVGRMSIRQAAASTLRTHSIAVGGLLVRNDIETLLAGARAEATLNGLAPVGGNRLVDTHTLIDHAAPDCPSHELYKHVLRGRGRAVFNGKIIVRQIAQKTDAKQTNKTLILSDEATIDTKPQLEIFADDVKCTHGATVGRLDENQVFYLRSRGIGEDDARRILTAAFADDILQRVRVASVRDGLQSILFADAAREQS